MRRVAITGLGIVSCLGNDYQTVVGALRRGQSGVRAMPDWRTHGLKSLVAGAVEGVEDKVEGARISKKLAPGMSEAALFCALAARDAVLDAGLSEFLTQQPVQLPASQPRLQPSLTSYQGHQQPLVYLAPTSRLSLLVVILSAHPDSVAQPAQAYSRGFFELFPRPVDTFPPSFFLNASGSTPVCSHRISKNDSSNA